MIIPSHRCVPCRRSDRRASRWWFLQADHWTSTPPVICTSVGPRRDDPRQTRAPPPPLITLLLLLLLLLRVHWVWLQPMPYQLTFVLGISWMWLSPRDPPRHKRSGVGTGTRCVRLLVPPFVSFRFVPYPELHPPFFLLFCPPFCATVRYRGATTTTTMPPSSFLTLVFIYFFFF